MLINGLSEKITMKNLETNTGLLPLKLGTAKVEEYTHTLIHFYDLNPVLLEINKLNIKSENLSNIILQNKDYLVEVSNYLKILNLTKERVEIKIKEILPHPERIKRGLINGLGSIFKAISGNLDANDGERYEKLIENLQTNQRNLGENIIKQNSISLDLINKFNNTIQTISHNEKLLANKINQIATFVGRQTNKENAAYIKDILIQVINMYEILNSILQDIENSISFAKLNRMHPSIIKTNDLFNQLQNLQKQVKPEQLPFEISLHNTLIYQNFIRVQCFILNNRITYLLKIPIMHPYTFNYYHLYAIPIFDKGQFKTIVPRNKFLIENKLYYTFQRNPCQEATRQHYICDDLDLQELKEDNPCEIQLLHLKNASTCLPVQVKLTNTLLKQVDRSNQYIGLFPNKDKIQLSCNQQEEILIVSGSYLIEIPIGCKVITEKVVVVNEQQETNNDQPILFPNLEMPSDVPNPDITIQLEDTNLDELQEIKTQILETQPQLNFLQSSYQPSLWTMLIYILVLISAVYLLYKKFQLCSKEKEENPVTPMVDLSTVQLNP